MPDVADVVICGAGIAGTALAYHLASRRAVRRVVLVDEREPLTLTSDKGTQAYRNWWPGPDATMLRYMTRSIDLLEEMAEESGNVFRLNRRGYVFVTADEEGVERLRATARDVSAFGMGELRDRAVRLASGATIATARVAIAAGPGLPDVARMLDLELPVFHELHAKLTIRDRVGVVSRAIPFLIWNDPVDLPWSDAERERFLHNEDDRRLLATFPGGVHVRPVDGPYGDELYVIWTYDIAERPFVWPPRFDPHYGEIAVRGLARMLPAMSAYAGTAHEGVVDGGYYCKTRENPPLVG